MNKSSNDGLPSRTLAFLWGYLLEAARYWPRLAGEMSVAVDEAESQGLPVSDELRPTVDRTPDSPVDTRS